MCVSVFSHAFFFELWKDDDSYCLHTGSTYSNWYSVRVSVRVFLRAGQKQRLHKILLIVPEKKKTVRETMVTVGSAKKKKKHEKGLLILFCVFYCIATAGIAVFSLTTNVVDQPQGPNNNDPKLRGGSGLGDRPTSVVDDSSAVACRYKSLDFLSADELQPKAGPRHMVNPPSGGTLSLVCCNTTAGPLSIVAHHQWAPLGVQRFLEMVTTGYFDKGVPLMRCVHNFLCQVKDNYYFLCFVSIFVIFTHPLITTVYVSLA